MSSLVFELVCNFWMRWNLKIWFRLWFSFSYITNQWLIYLLYCLVGVIAFILRDIPYLRFICQHRSVFYPFYIRIRFVAEKTQICFFFISFVDNKSLPKAHFFTQPAAVNLPAHILRRLPMRENSSSMAPDQPTPWRTAVTGCMETITLFRVLAVPVAVLCLQLLWAPRVPLAVQRQECRSKCQLLTQRLGDTERYACRYLGRSEKYFVTRNT